MGAKMKRIISMTLLLLFFIASFDCKKEEEATIELRGIINFFSGTVKLILDGKEDKASIGYIIKQGMTIKVIGDKSFVDIYFDENAIKLLGNTTVDIKKLASNVKDNTTKSDFFLEKGKMFSRIKKKLTKGELYQVTTPTATAGVRGTDFLVSEEEGNANVACLSGMVSVLNNSLGKDKSIILNNKEETDISEGNEMIKQQISADKIRMLNILTEIKAMRDDIRKKFEKQREEILKHVVIQREKDKKILKEQKEKDKAIVEDQKKRDKKNIDEIKGTTEEKAEKAKEEAKEKMAEAKNVDKASATKEAEEMKKSVKPKIEKLKINKDQFKKKPKG